MAREASNGGIVRLRKCKVKGCKRLGRIESYWYCKVHRVWMERFR